MEILGKLLLTTFVGGLTALTLTIPLVFLGFEIGEKVELDEIDTALIIWAIISVCAIFIFSSVTVWAVYS